MTPAVLRERLSGLMIRDRRRLGRRLEQARDERMLARIAADIENAEARVERRRLSVPACRYPPSLPVAERRDEILAALREHPVVIVAGETGSGKSTQLPKICLEAGRGVRGMIGHTQPRRIAARAVAERVAEELGTEIGALVGYTVRFTDRAGENTLIRVMTDGILLAELQRDRMLDRYDTIIVDEAHERSLNIDFILGYLKQLLPQRPDLQIIVTSATIDTARFAHHFDGAPVVEVSGRTYPVEIRYRPIGDDEGADRDQPQAIGDAVEELWTEGPGDILVFLSGEREIRDAADALGQLGLPDTELMPLYARLSAAEQHRVFAPHPGRRVVLATNVAETSLTVPGIRYVVDPGTARVSRYSHRTKVQRLPIEPVSQASANQRAGRCGRVAPGICIRLYSEEDFESRPEFTQAEILRTNLASVILQMSALGLGDVAAFPFVEPPDRRNIADGVALLTELGAVDDGNDLTPLGSRLARLPIDPRLGRMVLEAGRHGCVREVIVIAAALSIQDPRERPADRRALADAQHARFADPTSDFLTYLNLWTYIAQRQESMSSSQFRKLCRAEYLNYLRVREWQDIAAQLREVARGLGLGINRKPADPKRIHRSLLAGLLSHIGLREGPRMDYVGARGARFALSPGSALFRKPPKWVMAAELVETTRLWAHTNARVQPEWAEPLAGHLVKRSYGEPFWDDTRGSAVALETVRLYGLPIVPARKVDFGRVDPGTARELFIRHALVRGEWSAQHDFLNHNRTVLAEVRSLEDRLRRRHVALDEDALFDFYESRIGTEVVSGRHFDEWWEARRTSEPHLLELTPDEAIAPGAGAIGADEYPTEWRQDGRTFAVSYEFDPASQTDGVTVEIPLAHLAQVRSEGFDWHVPGMRRELVTALVRSLPKGVRPSFASPADRADAFLAEASPDDGPLREMLAAWLGVPSAFREDRIPPYLRITFCVTDSDGATVALGKDLDELRRGLRGRLRDAVTAATRSAEQTGLTTWSFGELSRTLEGPGGVVAYPALADEGDSVAIRVFASEAEQRRAMAAGTRRLLLLTLAPTTRSLDRMLPAAARTALARRPGVLEDCLAAATDLLVAQHGGPAWDEASFHALRDAVRVRLVETVESIATSAGHVLAAAAAVERRLKASKIPAPAATDIQAQLRRLAGPRFVAAAGARRLPDILRYLRAAERRLEKLPDDPARDHELMGRVQTLERELDRMAPGMSKRAVAQIRWMLEELRVSLFAQQLGTAYRVSEQRIRREMSSLLNT